MKDLSPRQLRFVQLYVRLGNATEAARQAGYKGNVDVQAARLLGNARIRQMVEAAKQDLQALFAAEAYDSLMVLKRLRDTAESETVRLQAAKDLLDRAGYKPAEKVEHGGQVSMHHDADLGALAQLFERHPELVAAVLDDGGSAPGGGAGES
ncbi:MAG: terminase small subunit [Actinomycetia bacterium]|nr:terminase small subunit [Actinomycetes bacterium]